MRGREPFAIELDTGRFVVHSQATAIAVANLAPARTVLAHGPSHLLADDGKVDVTVVATHSVLEAIATGVHLYRKAQTNEPAERVASALGVTGIAFLISGAERQGRRAEILRELEEFEDTLPFSQRVPLPDGR